MHTVDPSELESEFSLRLLKFNEISRIFSNQMTLESNVVNLRENGFLKNSHRDGKSRGERVLKG